MTERPVVPRFNPWGKWQPLTATCQPEVYSRTFADSDKLPSHAAKAAFLYCAFSEYVGIEFVVISNGSDPAPFRRHPNGIILVPCSPHGRQDSLFLYDGWMPLENATPEAISRGLQTIDEVVSFGNYVLGSVSRWVTKYAEGVGVGGSVVHLSDDDQDHLQRSLTRLHELPMALQEAVSRAVHWIQHSKVQLRPTDGLLALWQALESLLLATYERAPDLGLPLQTHAPSLSKVQRKNLRQEHIQRILNEELTDPQRGVERAYYEAIKGIRRRCEEVLQALLGEDMRIRQLFDPNPAAWSPNRIRNAIMHEGRSALEIESACDVPSRVVLLRTVVSEVIARIFRRSFAGTEVPFRQQNASMSIMDPLKAIFCVPNGGVKIEGDFSISLSLLLAKGVL